MHENIGKKKTLRIPIQTWSTHWTRLHWASWLPQAAPVGPATLPHQSRATPGPPTSPGGEVGLIRWSFLLPVYLCTCSIISYTFWILYITILAYKCKFIMIRCYVEVKNSYPKIKIYLYNLTHTYIYINIICIYYIKLSEMFRISFLDVGDLL